MVHQKYWKIKMKIIPVTKPGTERPMEVRLPMNLSSLPPGLRIDSGARMSEKIHESKIMKKVSSSVTGILSPTSCVTGNCEI